MDTALQCLLVEAEDTLWVTIPTLEVTVKVSDEVILLSLHLTDQNLRSLVGSLSE